MDINEIVSGLKFPSEEAKCIFITFYEFLQEYMNEKQTNPDEFDPNVYLENSDLTTFTSLMKNYVPIFNETLLQQHEYIFLNWRIWNKIFRKDLTEFFNDYVGFQRDMNIRLNNESNTLIPRSLRVSSTPLSTSRGISPFGQSQLQPRLSTINKSSTSRIKNFSVQEIRRLETPQSSFLFPMQNPDQRITVPSLRQEVPSQLLTNLTLNDSERLQAIRALRSLNKEQHPIRFFPLTPSSGTSTNLQRSTESLSPSNRNRRPRRRKKIYNTADFGQIKTFDTAHRDMDTPLTLNFNLLKISNQIPNIDISNIELCEEVRLPPIPSLQIDSERFDTLFDEISDTTYVNLSTRQTNTDNTSIEKSVFDYLMPELPPVRTFRETLTGSNELPQNNLSELNVTNIEREDFNESPEVCNVTQAIVHPKPGEIEDNGQLPEIQPSGATFGGFIPSAIFYTQNINKDIRSLNAINRNDQNVIKDNQNLNAQLNQSESEIQVQNDIFQEIPNISDSYQRKDWIEILRDRQDSNINMNDFISTTKRKRRKRRIARTLKNTDLPLETVQLNEQPIAIQQPEESNAEDQRNFLQNFLNIMGNDAPPSAIINQVESETQNQETMEVENEFANVSNSASFFNNESFVRDGSVVNDPSFVTKYKKWKESYLASNSEKYQKYLKISSEYLKGDHSQFLNDLRDIFENYTLKESDIISSKELFDENMSHERKEEKKQVIKSLKDYEIIQILNNMDEDNQTEEDPDILFTLEK